MRARLSELDWYAGASKVCIIGNTYLFFVLLLPNLLLRSDWQIIFGALRIDNANLTRTGQVISVIYTKLVRAWIAKSGPRSWFPLVPLLEFTLHDVQGKSPVLLTMLTNQVAPRE